MTTPRINPAVVLKAAEMAMPPKENNPWFIDKHGVCREGIDGFTISGWQFFNPLAHDSDAMKLERALKQQWWAFSAYAKKDGILVYVAIGAGGRPENLTDPSDTLLLLKCVAAQYSIELFVGDV